MERCNTPGYPDMTVSFSISQVRRLTELGVKPTEQKAFFQSVEERDRCFQIIENRHIRNERKRLEDFRNTSRKPRLCGLESRLSEVLAANGFVQLATPIIMSKGLLAKMGIGDDHPLNSQIFWLNPKQCLRPMLAPHLYYIVKDLLRYWEKPIRIFETGPCFRKESQGAAHSNEFTMLNLAEFGLSEADRGHRIQEFAQLVLKTAGIGHFRLEAEASEVYGETIDVIAGSRDLEVGSAAMGPHPIDHNWRITDTWVGIGFGLERLLMAGQDHANAAKMGRSLAYLDGIRLNL